MSVKTPLEILADARAYACERADDLSRSELRQLAAALIVHDPVERDWMLDENKNREAILDLLADFLSASENVRPNSDRLVAKLIDGCIDLAADWAGDNWNTKAD
jgi:hypothetical protein